MVSNNLIIPESLITILRSAKRVCVLTGSGISAESGIPTFREAQTGLWAQYDPQELATPQAFRRNPRLVWEWYSWRRQLVSKAKPNPGHKALVEIEVSVPRFDLITQNIDGLHRLAGNKRVIELHGNIARNKCFEENTIISEWQQGDEIPPSCPNCGGYLRPDVVWFGEALPRIAIESAIEATRSCDLFLSVGTSTLVHPAASLPFEALENGAIVAEINTSNTPLTEYAHFVLRGSAASYLPALLWVTFHK